MVGHGVASTAALFSRVVMPAKRSRNRFLRVQRMGRRGLLRVIVAESLSTGSKGEDF
jgi:hypothetical protein